MTGTARLAIRLAPLEDSIMLDTRDLTIRRITDARGNPLGYALGATQKIIGSRLAIGSPWSTPIRWPQNRERSATESITPGRPAGWLSTSCER